MSGAPTPRFNLIGATSPGPASPGTTSLSPAAFEALAVLLKRRSGLAIGPDKLYLLETRLAPILRQDGLRDLTALAERLRGPDSEQLARDVVEAMTTNESFFFRDGKPFRHFREVMLPRLHADRPPGARLRVWSAAAASGQEAYSVAMIVAECAELLGGRAVDILGTDISPAQIARAKAGTYSQFEVGRGLPAALLAKYFARDGAGWTIQPPVLTMPHFREWNLLSPLNQLGRFDVVFCRNVLLYFDADTKSRVLEAIADIMLPDGVLYLGGTETVIGVCARFVAAEAAGAFRLRG